MTENDNLPPQPGTPAQFPAPEPATEPVTTQQPVWAGTAPPPPYQASWYPAAPSAPPAQTPVVGHRGGRLVGSALLGFLLAAGGGVIGGALVHQADTTHTTATG